MRYEPEIISRIENRLKEPLPGIEAHLTMAPPLFSKDLLIPENHRKGAVLLLLYPVNGKLHVPFMKRTDDGRVHGGQISFPGGQVEEADLNFTYTALREAEEEMGIPSKQVQILGALSELYIVPSNFMVYPRVGFLSQRPAFLPDPVEVAEIIEVEMETFFRHGVKDMHELEVYGGRTIHAPGYTVQDRHLIWGGTSMILAEFFKIFEEIS